MQTIVDVCLVTGDPPLNPRNRGTAIAMWAVVERMLKKNLSAKIIVVVSDENRCPDRARYRSEQMIMVILI
jgi:hypothetical protein